MTKGALVIYADPSIYYIEIMTPKDNTIYMVREVLKASNVEGECLLLEEIKNIKSPQGHEYCYEACHFKELLPGFDLLKALK